MSPITVGFQGILNFKPKATPHKQDNQRRAGVTEANFSRRRSQSACGYNAHLQKSLQGIRIADRASASLLYHKYVGSSIGSSDEAFMNEGDADAMILCVALKVIISLSRCVMHLALSAH